MLSANVLKVEGGAARGVAKRGQGSRAKLLGESLSLPAS